MSSVPTFAQNMQNLYGLKSQLQAISYMFSPDYPNYHQINQTSKLKSELSDSQKQIVQLQAALKSSNKDSNELLQKTEKQLSELEQVNLELVGYNDRLVQQLESMSSKLQKVAAQLEQERQLRKDLQVKHAREIQNLKLMHSQELYILKKKDKKIGN